MATSALTTTTDLGNTIAARASQRTGGIKQVAEGRSDTFKVNPFKIEIESGFNVRDFESPEVAEHVDNLAQSIAAIGVQRPLKIRNKGSKYILVDGECRLRATIRAIDVYGAEIHTVPVILADRSMSDADATLGILVENSGLDVTPLGKAEIVKRLTGFGWSKEDIAAKSGMSTARVFQLIDMSGLGHEVKGLISAGIVSSTTALAVARANNFDDDATVRQIKDASDTKMAKSGSARVTTKVLGGSMKSKLAAIFTHAFDEGSIDESKEGKVSITFGADEFDAIKKLLKL